MASDRVPRPGFRAVGLSLAAVLAALVLALMVLTPSSRADEWTTTVSTDEATEEITMVRLSSSGAETASSSLALRQPQSAADGLTSTYWAAISFRYPQWWQVDLGAPHRVVKISTAWLRQLKPRKYFYTIEGSLDGQDWQLLADRSTSSAFNCTNDHFDVVVRYVRVNVLRCRTGRAGIKECRIIGDPAIAEAAASTVVAPPLPDATPTPTPTPTPTSTPTPTPTTTSGPLVLNNAHDLVYENVVFEGKGSGWGDNSGLIYISGASYNITFRNCVIGTNQDGVGNGVKILDSGRGMHDITFDNCIFKYQPRMGIEVNGRADPSEGGTGGKSYYNVNVTNCTFEASAGEAISYDDNTEGKPNRAGTCVVSGNLVKGAGVGTTYQYGKVFEINGNHDMIVTGNTFYAGRDGILNLNMRDTAPCGWVFSNNVVDATKIAPGITVRSIAQPLLATNVYGGTFAGNVITNLNSWNIAYISACHDMDWRTTQWLGPDNVPYQINSSGNLF